MYCVWNFISKKHARAVFQAHVGHDLLLHCQWGAAPEPEEAKEGHERGKGHQAQQHQRDEPRVGRRQAVLLARADAVDVSPTPKAAPPQMRRRHMAGPL